MKHFAQLSLILLLLMGLNACHPEEEIYREESRMKTLLHQQRWQLTALMATVDTATVQSAPEKNDTQPQDWYALLPDCTKDNVFITEAPGTGRAGELGAEEGNLRCNTHDLSYPPHIAGWKLGDTEETFSITLFDTGHRMLYGYELEESYHTENWQVDILNEQTWQVRVDKVRDSIAYDVIMRFKALP